MVQKYAHCITAGKKLGEGPCAYQSRQGERADEPGMFFEGAMSKDKTVRTLVIVEGER